MSVAAAETKQLFINNEWRAAASGKTMDVINPATEEVCASVASADASDAVALGVESFDAGGTSYFLSTSGIAGTATGFWVAVLFRVAAQSGSANRFLFRTISAASGWRIRTTTTHAALSFQAAGADTVFVTSPAYTIVAGNPARVVKRMAPAGQGA